jgi:alpha-tubulin suppressor-like RCC1 family protein
MMIAPGAAMGNMAALISGVDNAIQIAAGHQHACVLRNTGIVSCWGSNQFDQLGSTSMTTAVPVDVVGIGGITAVAVGDQHGCGRDAKGAVYCWGQDIDGQLGDGGSLMSATPVQTVGF